MTWASAVSDLEDLTAASLECARDILGDLGGRKPDLAVLFISSHHAPHFHDVAEMIMDRISPHVLLGCSAGGVIGGGHEVEHRPGLSITAALLPGVQLHPFHVETPQLPDLDSSPRAWEELLGVDAKDDPQFLVMPDPFTFDAESFLTGLDYAFSRSAKVGGLASAASQPGENALFLNDEMFHEGCVGLAMTGNIRVDTIVAQGCRPVGSPMRITKCHRNLLIQLEGRPPLEILQDMHQTLSPRDRELFNHSLFLGIVTDEFKDDYEAGDFLVRNIIGLDRSVGTLAVGAMLRERQVVQFHLRDALTSTEDLQRLLARHAEESASDRPRGGLLFSCLGRGMYLYGQADHDTNLFRDYLGDVPLGGFFCNGEIGPVAGATYLHGYTSSFGLFRSKED